MFKGDGHIHFSTNQLGYFKKVIKVFTTLIESNRNKDYAIWNSRGICKLHLAIAQNDMELLQSAIVDFTTVVENCKDCDQDEYMFGMDNLFLARKAILRLKELNSSDELKKGKMP